jgi:hypothetical protein
MILAEELNTGRIPSPLDWLGAVETVAARRQGAREEAQKGYTQAQGGTNRWKEAKEDRSRQR